MKEKYKPIKLPMCRCGRYVSVFHRYGAWFVGCPQCFRYDGYFAASTKRAAVKKWEAMTGV